MLCCAVLFGAVQVLTCQPLPAAEPEFFELLNLYFPCVFDIKYLMKFCDNLHGGLNKLAELLDVQVGWQLSRIQSSRQLPGSWFFLFLC